MGSARNSMNLFAALQQEPPKPAPAQPEKAPDVRAERPAAPPKYAAEQESTPKKRGRKEQYVNGFESVSIRMDALLFKQMDAVARYKGMSRTAYITSLIEADTGKNQEAIRIMPD